MKRFRRGISLIGQLLMPSASDDCAFQRLDGENDGPWAYGGPCQYWRMRKKHFMLR